MGIERVDGKSKAVSYHPLQETRIQPAFLKMFAVAVIKIFFLRHCGIA
jgi:hypothetical protein